ncbi:MAG TPA: 5-formyltetrahydrofolate cyclo-ligase [Burkholderiaceae bacterium]|jgi:5,10-methenyltetrahydrofolate synthetase|nr:5-formyltetrahydrofolate cyclo-ligase [Burkholderiaceae bacterium]
MKGNPTDSAGAAPRPRRTVDPLRAQWRRELRAAREALADRPGREARLLARVEHWLQSADVARLAFFWPTRGEPDLAALVSRWLQADCSRIAGLPVIEGELLRFAPWSPGVPLVSGPFDIQIPDTERRIDPQLLLIPCVGIDAMRYRLGYGGGYYDRTLAALSPRPLTVGVGFDCARIETIDPKPHDLRLDVAMTESGSW